MALIALAGDSKRKKYERKEKYEARIRDRQEKAFAFASGIFAMLIGYAAEYVVAEENFSLPKRAELNPLKNEAQYEYDKESDDEEYLDEDETEEYDDSDEEDGDDGDDEKKE